MDNKRKQISLVDTYKNLVSNITDDHIWYLQVLVGLFVCLLTLYVFTRKVARTISGSSILLVGGTESGKTALAHTLANEENEKTPLTVTSFKENVVYYNNGQKRVRLVDIPGHERVRSSAFDRHKSDVRGILFMLDSSTLQTQVRDVAEQLFTVLSDDSVRRSCCPVAIVCNKQDHEMAKSAAVIERALQREIDQLRETAGSKLRSFDSDKSTKVADIGIEGQPFTFSDLSSNAVTFIEATVLDSKNINEITEWLGKA